MPHNTVHSLQLRVVRSSYIPFMLRQCMTVIGMGLIVNVSALDKNK
jgi:hypothetical protein